MGLPDLPDPPPPMTLRDGYGNLRTLHFRVWRAPTGVEVSVEELDAGTGGCYRRSVLGPHDADVAELAEALREIATDEIGRRQLRYNPHRAGWLVGGDVVEGEFVWSKDGNEVGSPYDVAIDGQLLSWDEYGRTLEAFEGWRFRLEIVDQIEDLRPDAELTDLLRIRPTD